MTWLSSLPEGVLIVGGLALALLVAIDNVVQDLKAGYFHS
jgi:hypothetical protein